MNGVRDAGRHRCRRAAEIANGPIGGTAGRGGGAEGRWPGFCRGGRGTRGEIASSDLHADAKARRSVLDGLLEALDGRIRSLEAKVLGAAPEDARGS
jgi:hypothetical protein